MQSDNILENVNKQIREVLVEFPEVFLVKVAIKPVSNIKVFVDTDLGISIDTCIKINRQLYKKIEETGMFAEGDFSLEVSSPGLSEPLLLNRQYKKNIGKILSVKLKTGVQITGLLLSCTEDGLVLETRTGKGKKEVVASPTLLFEEIEKAFVEVIF